MDSNGDFIIKVAVNLQLKLVIDFEDFRFLPPPKTVGVGNCNSGVTTHNFYYF